MNNLLLQSFCAVSCLLFLSPVSSVSSFMERIIIIFLSFLKSNFLFIIVEFFHINHVSCTLCHLSKSCWVDSRSSSLLSVCFLVRIHASSFLSVVYFILQVNWCLELYCPTEALNNEQKFTSNLDHLFSSVFPLPVNFLLDVKVNLWDRPKFSLPTSQASLNITCFWSSHNAIFK